MNSRSWKTSISQSTRLLDVQSRSRRSFNSNEPENGHRLDWPIEEWKRTKKRELLWPIGVRRDSVGIVSRDGCEFERPMIIGGTPSFEKWWSHRRALTLTLTGGHHHQADDRTRPGSRYPAAAWWDQVFFFSTTTNESREHFESSFVGFPTKFVTSFRTPFLIYETLKSCELLFFNSHLKEKRASVPVFIPRLFASVHLSYLFCVLFGELRRRWPVRFYCRVIGRFHIFLVTPTRPCRKQSACFG